MASKTGGNKKSSSERQKGHYKAYRNEDRRLRNKLRGLRRHMNQSRHFNDTQGALVLEKMS